MASADEIRASAASGPESVRTKTKRITAALSRLEPIDVPAALAALGRLTGDEGDVRIVAETIGLLEGRIEALLDAPEIAAVLRG